VGSGDQSQTDDCGLERRERDRTAADAEEHDEEKNDRWYPSKHIDHDARPRSNHPRTGATPGNEHHPQQRSDREASGSHLQRHWRRREDTSDVLHQRSRIAERKVRVRFTWGLLITDLGSPCSMIRPSAMTIRRSATSAAKWISWVTTIIVIPWSASWRMTAKTSRPSSGSSADVGSSKSMIFGSS